MKKFVYKEKMSLYYNWFTLQSKILFPESPKRQKKAFDSLYYRFVLKHRKHSAYRLKKIGALVIARKLDKLIGQRVFLEKLEERINSVQTAGIAARLMFSMAHHKFSEPSVNKVKSLYSYRFTDLKNEFEKREKDKFLAIENKIDATPAKEKAIKPYRMKSYPRNVGDAHVGKSLDIHRDVLPYCVAHSLCRPEAAQSCDEFIKEVDRFLFLAEAFREYCLHHKQARKGGGAKPFVDSKKLLEVDFWPLSPAKETDIKPYSLKNMVKYAERANLPPLEMEPSPLLESPPT